MELPHDKWAFFGLLAVLLYLAINQTIARRHAKVTRRQLDHEMKPNSGSTLRDAVNRIEARQLEDHESLVEVRRRTRALEDVVERRGSLRRRSWRRSR